MNLIVIVKYKVYEEVNIQLQINKKLMNQKQLTLIKATISNDLVYTNSLIKLSVPIQYKQSQCSFQWYALNPNQQLNSPDIFERTDCKKNCKNSSYQCTPLDYGIFLIGRVIVQKNGDKDIIKQTKYGPVFLDNQLKNEVMNQKPFNVKVVINKNNLVPGTIKVSKSTEEISKQVKLKIVIQFDDLNFQVKLDKSIILAASSPFVKFYDKQQNCLGISMYHQHSQFMEKLKKIKIFTHFGFYFKVYFQDRIDRDIFLLQLLYRYGIKVPEIQQRTQNIQINVKSAGSVINSQMSAYLKNSTLEQKAKIKEVDEEFYRLLYEPSQVGVNGQQISFDAADAQFLFQSVKKSDLRKSILETLIKQSVIFSKEQKKQKKQEKSHQKNKKSGHLEKKSNYIQLFPSIEKKQFERQRKPNSLERFYKPNQWLRNHSSGCFNKDNQLKKTIQKLTNQIEGLLKENRKLVNQNKKLKDQNMKLRFKDIKNNSKILLRKEKQHQSKKHNTQSNPNSPSQAVSSPKQANGVKKSDMISQQQNKLDFSSKNLSYKQIKSKTQGNLINNEGTPSQTERNFTINFTSLSTISNNQFFKQQEINKHQKKQQKNNANFSSTKIFFPRQGHKNKKGRSKEKHESPSRPFIPVKNPGKSSKNFDDNSAIISRDYHPETPSFKNSMQPLSFGSASTKFFSKYLNH